MTTSGVPEEQHTLITGGAGFIGSHLTERLLKAGEKVVVIDDLSTGSLENLPKTKDKTRLRFIKSEVTSCEELDKIVAKSKYVYHLAAAVGVDFVMQSPIRTIETNLKSTEAILEAAAYNNTPILLPSSSEVYGKSSREAFAETDDLLIGPPTLGRWSYACSKLMDEFLALAFYNERQLPVTVVRLFNTVGPRQTGRYGMVLPRFIEAAKTIAKEGLKANVVSMPCLDKFVSQDKAYRDSIIDPEIPKLVVEALHPNSWHCLANLNDIVIGMETFGESAPGNELMNEFGFTVDNIVSQVKKLTAK